MFAESEGVLKKFRVKRPDSPNVLSTFCLGLGRVLLACTVVLVAIMPWTEYFWHFDRFLHGGEDCELGLLALLAMLCLVLLLFQQGKKSLEDGFNVRHRLRLLFRSKRAMIMPNPISSLVAPHDAMPLQCPALDMYNLPLQV